MQIIFDGNVPEQVKDSFYKAMGISRDEKGVSTEYIKENADTTTNVDSMYSDRMYSWDYAKFNKCLQEVFGNQGQYFSDRSPADIEKFIGLYTKSKVELLMIKKYVNQSSGFDHWHFTYRKL